MTQAQDVLPEEASRNKLRAARKGTLFQTLTALFTLQDLSGGFDGKSSEKVFLDGLANKIWVDYSTLKFIAALRANPNYDHINPSVPDDDRQVYEAIENRVLGYWANIMRYQTPQEMSQAYGDQFLPGYRNLMQNGVISPCPLLGLARHDVASVEVLVSLYHMSQRAAEMMRILVPDFSLPGEIEGKFLES